MSLSFTTGGYVQPDANAPGNPFVCVYVRVCKRDIKRKRERERNRKRQKGREKEKEK